MVKVSGYTDLDPARWREYPEIITESLWLLGARDRSGPHAGDYWGNFVPQIPYQLIRRFTREGEAVVDLFSGMGTTLIECRRLGRHGLGVELNPKVSEAARRRVLEAANPYDVRTETLAADSTQPETGDLLSELLRDLGHDGAQLLILHPPYHDIIRFDAGPGDLSAAEDLDRFLESFREAGRNAWNLLQPGRFLGLVIGDKYSDGEWVPLGFECMAVLRELGFQLKAINIKDIQGNERGKGKNLNLWRYRSLKLGFYIFKHEYVMVFRRP